MRRAEHGFDGSRAGVSPARRFAVSTICRWGMSDLGDDVELLVSELVTNAVVHASGGGVVHCLETPTGVRIDVADCSTTEPRIGEPKITDLSGRGLGMVDRVSESWGVDRRPDGNTVWFELLTDQVHSSASTQMSSSRDDEPSTASTSATHQPASAMPEPAPTTARARRARPRPRSSCRRSTRPSV